MFSTSHYLSQLLVGTSVLLALSSCSLFSSPSSTSLSLAEADNAGWKEVQQTPYVYEIVSTPSGTTYMTAIKECDKKKALSPVVATRQLLVGLKDIRIESQEKLTVADVPAVRSHVKARLEDQPLDLLTYTVPHDTCVYDFVLWRTLSDGRPDDSAGLLASSEPFSQFLAQHFTALLE